jgi:hypothetical protein
MVKLLVNLASQYYSFNQTGHVVANLIQKIREPQAGNRHDLDHELVGETHFFSFSFLICVAVLASYAAIG